MINANTLVVYKNKPAIVKEKNQDKITIALIGGDQVKVREKDIESIHPGGTGIGDRYLQSMSIDPRSVRETWELLLADEAEFSLKDLAELAFGEYSPASAWAAYCLLSDGLYFVGTINAIHPRLRDQVEADEKKREEKQRASGERGLFLERLRKRSPIPDDRRFMQDVEALALGKSVKSRTMKDIDLGETPEEAHSLLLECGFWTNQNNPHPSRFGVSLLPAQQIPEPPPHENRCDLTHLAAFAIDSPWSSDPDDAISLEQTDGKQILYVHVADPSASIGMDHPAEREARDRGVTLYIPEGTFRMIADEALPFFALGVTELSPALTFKMIINANSEIEETAIFPSVVKVTRLTYEGADSAINEPHNDANAEILHDLYDLAKRNFKRRCIAGAVPIDMPEIHITLDREEVIIEPMIRYRSAELVRECMLLAGEGAGIWAMQRNVPIPYIEQETGDFPDVILPGLAGSYQLRRCMRPRILSVKPGRHWGLGMDAYTQVTSPLRRYTDILSHIQIRAFLRGEKPLPDYELASRLAAGEAAAAAVTQAERASRNHWTMAYLSSRKDSAWDAIALEKKVNRYAVIIPALALETQVPLRKNYAPNEPLKLVLKSVNIPKGEAVFI